jgi:hypothetical protein
MMKPTSSILTLISVCLLWLAFVLGCASSGKLSGSDANANVERLAPLNNEQKAGVLLIVKGTDDLDVLRAFRIKACGKPITRFTHGLLRPHLIQFENAHHAFVFGTYSRTPFGKLNISVTQTQVVELLN